MTVTALFQFICGILGPSGMPILQTGLTRSLIFPELVHNPFEGENYSIVPWAGGGKSDTDQKISLVGNSGN